MTTSDADAEDLARVVFNAMGAALKEPLSWDEVKKAAEQQPWQKASLDFIYSTAKAILSAGYRKTGTDEEGKR